MMDLAMIALTLAFLLGSIGLIAVFERVRGA
jgi:hypothetical protein